jgi:hypothetical protein
VASHACQFVARARPWVLGGRVLRAETAVVVGLTAVHTTWGDFRGAEVGMREVPRGPVDAFLTGRTHFSRRTCAALGAAN